MQLYYLYKIVNRLNNKLYIGQTNDPTFRWNSHIRLAKSGKSNQYIHRAINSHGIENFHLEVIATCKTRENANELECMLIDQYDTLNKVFGYNLRTGGKYGGLTDEIKQKISAATHRQIETQGHPSQGKKRTPEQVQRMIETRKNIHIDYTPELRQRMSEAHIGLKETEETKQRKAVSMTINWAKRNAEREATGEIKCNAPGCEIQGTKVKYRIVDGVRYCRTHGSRMLRNGHLDLTGTTSRKVVLSDNIVQAMIDLYQSGKSCSVIATQFGYSDEFVRKLLIKQGVVLRDPNELRRNKNAKT